jgi:hypothetical protein
VSEANKEYTQSKLPEQSDLYQSRAISWGTSFIRSLLKEPREIICGKGKRTKKIGPNSQAILTALAATISRKFGFTDATSLAIAVWVLINLGIATKKAFVG